MGWQALRRIAVTPQTRWEWSAWLIAVALLGGLWIVWSRPPATADPASENGASIPAPVVGSPAPPFALAAPDGATVSTADLRGRPVVLNFWATWCAPCRAEMPALQATAEQFAGAVHVIGVNQGETAEQVTAFATAFGIAYPLVLDADDAVSRLYRVRALPTTFLIDADGVVRAVIPGAVSAAVLADRLNALVSRHE